MHMHQVMYSTKNNIYVTASYTKIVIVEGCYLIWKPSLGTSLCVGMLYINAHTPAICLSKSFWVTVDVMYISYYI